MHVRDKIRIELYLFLGIYKERDCMYTRKEETYSYICGKMYIHFNSIFGAYAMQFNSPEICEKICLHLSYVAF